MMGQKMLIRTGLMRLTMTTRILTQRKRKRKMLNATMMTLDMMICSG
jgi:hypothetical protein